MKVNNNKELYENLVFIWDKGSQRLIRLDTRIPECGIYHIRIGDESYIGKSKNLLQRLQDHLNGILFNGNLGSANVRRKFQQVQSMSIYVIEETSEEYLGSLERYYIEKYKPSLNRQLVVNQDGFEQITTKISPKNIYRLNMCKLYGYNEEKFHSRGEIISGVLDWFFEGNGEPEGMESYK